MLDELPTSLQFLIVLLEVGLLNVGIKATSLASAELADVGKLMVIFLALVPSISKEEAPYNFINAELLQITAPLGIVILTGTDALKRIGRVPDMPG